MQRNATGANNCRVELLRANWSGSCGLLGKKIRNISLDIGHLSQCQADMSLRLILLKSWGRLC